MRQSPEPSAEFQTIVNQIGGIGREKHTETILKHATANLAKIKNSIRDISFPIGKKAESAIVISAGPSVFRRNSIKRIKDSGYAGTIIAVDGSLVACLRQGLIPDYVLSLDPHPTRMVRWFGDPNYTEHVKADDYFERQDLDVEFRNNSLRRNQENIELINEFGYRIKAVVACTIPANVLQRLEEAKFPLYWWNPLVDDPNSPDSLTRKLYSLNRLPSLNTGGNVGTSSWTFATTTLKIPKVGLVGMDLGYFADTPLTKTQGYYELVAHLGGLDGIESYFCDFEFPLTRERFYTDTTYYWYRRNFLQLLEKSKAQTFNCTEGGTLYSDRLPCITLDDFIAQNR